MYLPTLGLHKYRTLCLPFEFLLIEPRREGFTLSGVHRYILAVIHDPPRQLLAGAIHSVLVLHG